MIQYTLGYMSSLCFYISVLRVQSYVAVVFVFFSFVSRYALRIQACNQAKPGGDPGFLGDDHDAATQRAADQRHHAGAAPPSPERPGGGNLYTISISNR